jgi:hypothetical protein
MLYNGPNHTPPTRNKINMLNLQLASCLRAAGSWDQTTYGLSHYSNKTNANDLYGSCTRWFKYDRDYLCVNKSQFVPVIFEPPCIKNKLLREFKPINLKARNRLGDLSLNEKTELREILLRINVTPIAVL